VSSENILYLFASLFSELVCAGISLRKSADILSSQPSVPPKVRALAGEISEQLEEGRNFSDTLALCTVVCVPQWFCAFVLAAEETGCIGPTMKYLSGVLSVRKDAKEKTVTALVYPAFVTVLSFASSLFCIFILPGMFYGSDTAAELSARSTAVHSCILGLIFLLCVSFAFGYAIKKTVTGSPLLRFMQSLAFLIESAVPLERALFCAFPCVERDRRLNKAVVGIRHSINAGKFPSSSFYENLSEHKFMFEAEIISLYLSMSEAGSSSSAFAKTASLLESREEKKRARLLGSMQPIMICVAAIYMAVVLKDSIVPLLFGGTGGMM
jgi:type II secretory pathway component PulF